MKNTTGRTPKLSPISTIPCIESLPQIFATQHHPNDPHCKKRSKHFSWEAFIFSLQLQAHCKEFNFHFWGLADRSVDWLPIWPAWWGKFSEPFGNNSLRLMWPSFPPASCSTQSLVSNRREGQYRLLLSALTNERTNEPIDFEALSWAFLVGLWQNVAYVWVNSKRRFAPFSESHVSLISFVDTWSLIGGSGWTLPRNNVFIVQCWTGFRFSSFFVFPQS